MPALAIPKPVVGYMLGCRVMRDGAPPPVSVHSVNDEGAWHCVVTWSQNYGVTVAFAGPFASRREAVLGMWEHLHERRSLEELSR